MNKEEPIDFLKNNLKIVSEEQPRHCYYERDPINIEIKMMLKDEVILSN